MIEGGRPIGTLDRDRAVTGEGDSCPGGTADPKRAQTSRIGGTGEREGRAGHQEQAQCPLKQRLVAEESGW